MAEKLNNNTVSCRASVNREQYDYANKYKFVNLKNKCCVLQLQWAVNVNDSAIRASSVGSTVACPIVPHLIDRGPA